MNYTVETLLKAQIKKVGFTSREIAQVLGLSPSTISNKLNGFCILKDTERRQIETAVENHQKEEPQNGSEREYKELHRGIF